MTLTLTLSSLMKHAEAAATSGRDGFTGTLTFGGLALVCIAFAWDGLVRRILLLHTMPIGDSVVIRRIGSALIGLLAAALSAFLLLMAGGFYLLGIRSCGGSYGCLVESVQPFAWVWFGMCFGWFALVWLRMGNPYKRVLVYGVWYYQQRAARPVIERLRTLGLPALSKGQLYALEEAVVGELHAQGWLSHGKAWLDGGKRIQREAPLAEIVTSVQYGLHEPILADGNTEVSLYQDSTVEREAVGALVTYFLARAERAKRMSPLARWWVGSGQIGKMQVYGRRAI